MKGSGPNGRIIAKDVESASVKKEVVEEVPVKAAKVEDKKVVSKEKEHTYE